MTLIDSVDSIIMLYSYSGFPDRSFRLFERRITIETQNLEDTELTETGHSTPNKSPTPPDGINQVPVLDVFEDPGSPSSDFKKDNDVTVEIDQDGVELGKLDSADEVARLMRVKRNAMSGLSILLTLMSILVAFTYVSCSDVVEHHTSH